MKTGLVILDMLNDFVDGTLANPAAKPIIGKIGEVADAVRNRDDWVVIYANDAHKPGSGAGQRKAEDHARHGG